MVEWLRVDGRERMAAGGGDKRSVKARSGGDKSSPADRKRDESSRSVVRAAIAAEFGEMFRQEARLRMSEGGKKGAEATNQGRAETTLPCTQDDSGRALAQAAAKVDPELLTMARDGKVNVQEAKRLAAMA